MNTSTSQPTHAIAILRRQGRIVQQVLHMNVDGLTQAETLVQPAPAGNCMNWVVGHLLAVYHHVLPVLGQQPVMPEAQLARYDRGSAPLRDSDGALDIGELMTAWDECCKRIDAGLASLTAERMDAPAPMSPTKDPNETIGSLLATISWHQSYHVGQTGILRRLAGKAGAIQ